MTQALAKTNIVAIESANSVQPARALSMTRSAIRSRERNAEKKAAALALAQAAKGGRGSHRGGNRGGFSPNRIVCAGAYRSAH
jgi:hypothetical protein